MSTGANDTPTGVALSAPPAAATTTTTSDSGSGGNTQGQAAPVAAPPTGSEGQQQQAAAFYTTFKDPELVKFVESKGFKETEALAKSYKELQTLHDSKQVASSAPATAADYKFTVPTDLPKGAEYNGAFADGFKAWAHEAKLSQEQAAVVHDKVVDYARQSSTAQAEAAAKKTSESIQNAFGELTNAWGKHGTPAFDRNLEMSKRAIRMADPKLMDSLREAGVVKTIEGQDMVVNATIFKAFAKMGAGMYAEDSLYGTPATDKNPFDDKSEDMAMQGRLMKEDPAKAALLIRASGKEKMFHQFMEKHGR